MSESLTCPICKNQCDVSDDPGELADGDHLDCTSCGERVEFVYLNHGMFGSHDFALVKVAP